MSTQDIQLVEKLAEFHDDPWSFVLFAFPWGEKGTDLEKFPLGPDEWQKSLFLGMADHVKANIEREQRGQQIRPWRSAVASGHGIGKSACVAWIILWMMSCRPWCRGLVTANTAEQLQDKTWPELAKWHQLAINKHWFKWTATQFYYALCPEDQRKNYSFSAQTWSEERMEGFAGLHNAAGAVVIIFDEASGLPDPLWEVASGAMTDGEAWWFAFGNPTRNTGRFRECFGVMRKYWWTLHVDSREVRITNKEYLGELVEIYGEDSDYIKVRVRGVFPSAGDKQFISSDMVDDAVKVNPVTDSGDRLVMGIDVARFGEDRTVVAFRRGRDAASIPFLKYRSLDTQQIAAMAIEAIMAHNPSHVFVDGVGVGGGVVDRLRMMGYRVIDVNAGSRANNPQRYFNKRAEMWGEMKEWLRRGGALPDDKELRQDLIGPEYTFSDKQQIKLERKDDMKRRGLASPDVADALALTFASKVPLKDTYIERNRQNRYAKNLDYDLFDY